MTDFIDQLDPSTLLPHPLNKQLYDCTPTSDLVSSIREHGIVEPLVVTPARILISGHRRREAALLLNIRLVPVITRVVSDDLGSIIAFNTHRKKTWTEVYREACALMPRASKAAEARKLEGARRGAAIRHGGNTGSSTHRKRAIDDVAERLNVSRETLRKLFRIFEALANKDAPNEIGERLDAHEYTVHQAHRLVCRSKRLSAAKQQIESATREGTFDWSERILWTDVWEFYKNRDNGFHEAHLDAGIVLDQAYGSPPADLFINLIHHFSARCDLVIDPFAGRGQVHRVAEAMGRRAWSSDLNPKAAFIQKLDALQGPPATLERSSLIIIDPPYGRDYRYSNDARDLSQLEMGEGWTSAVASVVRLWSQALSATGRLAIIVGNRFDTTQGKLLDRSRSLASRLESEFVLEQRIFAPYSPSHFRGYRIDRARRAGILLGRSREILVVRPGQ